MNNEDADNRSQRLPPSGLARVDSRAKWLPPDLEQAIKHRLEREVSQDAQPEVTVINASISLTTKPDHRQEEYVQNQTWNPAQDKANREKDAVIADLRAQLEDLKRRVSQLED